MWLSVQSKQFFACILKHPALGLWFPSSERNDLESLVLPSYCASTWLYPFRKSACPTGLLLCYSFAVFLGLTLGFWINVLPIQKWFDLLCNVSPNGSTLQSKSHSFLIWLVIKPKTQSRAKKISKLEHKNVQWGALSFLNGYKPRNGTIWRQK